MADDNQAGAIRSEPITGVVLAGGLGRRMGGADKGLQLLDGKPLVQWVVERLEPQVEQVLVNANRNIARYEALGYRVIPDPLPGFAGPLAGLQAALAYAPHPLVATVPCDAPFLPKDLIARLHTALVTSGADLAIASTLGQPQPVFCLCRRQLLPGLISFLASGQRQVTSWQRTVTATTVSFDDQADAFRNLNTNAELTGSADQRGPNAGGSGPS